MQIVIPMSGFGERFRRAGYSVPKPLIEIEGKPIISHVIDMFPGEVSFFFICNQDHLDSDEYKMEEIIRTYCPTGEIIGIKPHKLGPVHAVLEIQHLLDPDDEVVVNYCDFTCYWDWDHFKEFVGKANCNGAIPAYKGFHPHSLGNTNYAYMLEEDGWVQDIQEKKPYTNDRMNEFASSGTYYFSSARIMIESFNVVIDKNMNVSGEFYVSLAYKTLINKDQSVAVYPLQHFMQWGTPEDVHEYNIWSDAFKGLIDEAIIEHDSKNYIVMPMGGLGSRFATDGYKKTKPLIPVSGLPMVIQAANHLPPSKFSVFVLRKDMDGYQEVINEIRDTFPKAAIKTIDHVTEGQACTALLGLDVMDNRTYIDGPLTIGACDNGAIYDAHALQRMLDDTNIDVVVWGIKGYPNAIRNPNMYGWLNMDGNTIKSVSVKTPLESPAKDPIIIGTFTFKKSSDFRLVVDSLIKRDGKVNGEFYIDSCIEDAIALGLRCELFEINSYLCWGTPNDLRTFEYWQSCFDKWNGHPYKLNLDQHVPESKIGTLRKQYQRTTPEVPINYGD